MTGERERARGRELGDGPLGRATAGVYWLAVVTALLALASSPTVAVVLLLAPSASNVPFVALAALPLGPALSAALYATADRRRAEGLTPARSFWHGYALNWADVLRTWVPALAVLAVVGYVLANRRAAGLSSGYVAVLTLVAVVVAVWAMHAVAISSFFRFRARDVARLSAYYLGHRKGSTLGVLSLLVVALGIVWFASDVLLALLGGVWVWLWYRNVLPLLDDVRARFTAEGVAAPVAAAAERRDVTEA